MIQPRLRHFSRSAVALAFVVASVADIAEAHAEDPTKEQCFSANESAQSLRAGGKLGAARKQLLVCIDKSCPQAVRDDCAERFSDVERATPTIVFAATGDNGADLSAVTVTMDGAPLAERLDGSAVAVEPGEHTFEFASAGFPNVTKTFVVREGVKGRQEPIAFAPTVRSVVAAPLSGVAPAVDGGSSEAQRDSRRLVAYALGGAGIVGLGLGIVFGLRAQSTYDDAAAHCPTGPSSCNQDGVSGGKDAHTQAAVSTVAFVAGGALLAGGVVLFLTAPKAGNLNVQPTAGLSGGGLRLGGAW